MTAAKEDIPTEEVPADEEEKKEEVEAEPEPAAEPAPAPAKTLTGPELFAELKKLIPTVVEEDYKKGLSWQVEIMKLDAELVRRHRVECGADEIETGIPEYDPPPAETWSNLSKLGLPTFSGTTMASALAANLAKAAAFQQAKPAVGLGAMAAANLPKAKPSGIINGSAGPGESSTAGSGVSTSAASDLRQIAVFVAQWKLDPTKTKLLLAKLTPARRRWIMTNFKNTEGANGASSTTKLEEYILEAEAGDLWKDAETECPAPAAAPAAAVGVKRTLPATTEASKRPALGAGIRPLNAAGMMRPQGAAAMRPGMGMMGGMRPGMGMMGMRPMMNGMMGGMGMNMMNGYGRGW